MPQSFEREFLIRLAPIWLACRWRVMGHPLAGKEWPKPDLSFDLLGMCDYAAEMRMRLLSREALAARSFSCPAVFTSLSEEGPL